MSLIKKKYDADSWAKCGANEIQSHVAKLITQFGLCSVMLTGGRSASRLYLEWSSHPNFSKLQNVSFYFGDERCVSSNHLESNYALVMRTLFSKGIPHQCYVHRMEGDVLDYSYAAQNYEVLLPERIDIVIVTVGDDGHIASIFSGSPAFDEVERSVMYVKCKNYPFDRLTITSRVIKNAKYVYVLAPSASKSKILDCLEVDGESSAMPAKLVLDGTWMIEK